MPTKQAREVTALRLYDQGIPTTNPDATYRHLTEAHRWGRHRECSCPDCPVCKRDSGPAEEPGA